MTSSQNTNNHDKVLDTFWKHCHQVSKVPVVILPQILYFQIEVTDVNNINLWTTL
jgi:hypothetical protein